ncbi:AMP-binding protein [Austwickia chelonae]|uniref:AMP-binding protein n=1 Tax=Austwickia chelonae TaxID=100225 RepID=UPI003D321EA9
MLTAIGEHASVSPDRVAVVSKGVGLTYGDLRLWVGAVAASLREDLRVRPGDRVGVAADAPHGSSWASPNHAACSCCTPCRSVSDT